MEKFKTRKSLQNINRNCIRDVIVKLNTNFKESDKEHTSITHSFNLEEPSSLKLKEFIQDKIIVNSNCKSLRIK